MDDHSELLTPDAELGGEPTKYNLDKMLDNYHPDSNNEIKIEIEEEEPEQEEYEIEGNEEIEIDEDEKNNVSADRIQQHDVPSVNINDYKTNEEYQAALYALELEKQKAQQLESMIYQQNNDYLNNISALESQLIQTQIERSKEYEKSLLHEEKRIKSALYVAKEEGDSKTEIALFDALAELKGKKEALKLYNQSLPTAQNYNQNNYQPIIEPLPAQSYQPTQQEMIFNEWLTKNPWYNSDPNLRKEADEMGAELSKALHMNNSSKYVGTKAFYDIISEEMQKKYSFKKEATTDKKNQTVAPASSFSNPTLKSKGPQTMAEKYSQENRDKYKKTYKLSKQHYLLATNMNMGNKNVSKDELIKRYATIGMNAPKDPRFPDDPIAMRIPE